MPAGKWLCNNFSTFLFCKYIWSHPRSICSKVVLLTRSIVVYTQNFFLDKLLLGQKKVVLFSEIDRANFFYLVPAHISRTRMRIYIFYFKKYIQTKNFPLANLFVRIYVFFLQTIKYRALCFSTKKSAIRVVFKSKLYLKN